MTLLVGPVASFNFLLRLALFSSATSMFFMLRTCCRRVGAAFVGGLVYGFGPYLTSQAQSDAHLNLAFGPLPPVIIWCLYELIVVQRRRAIHIGLLLAGMAGFQALIDPEILAELAVVCTTGVVITLAIHRGVKLHKVPHFSAGLAAAARIFLVLTGDLFWSMLFASGHGNPGGVPGFASDLLSPITPTSNELIAPEPLARAADLFVSGNLTENGSYLGIPLLGAWAVTAVALRRDRLVRMTTGLGVVAFVLSLGARLTVDGHQTAVPLVEVVFVHLPLLDSTVPARYALVVALFASVAVAIGFDHALGALGSERIAHRWQWRIALSCLVLVGLAVDAPRAPFRSYGFAWPDVLDKALESIPSGSVVLTYPYPTDALWSEAMLWQAQ